MQKMKKSLALLIILTSIGSLTFAQDQDAFNLAAMLKFNGTLELQEAMDIQKKQEHAREVIQDNGCTFTTNEVGIFLSNSLMLNGKPLDFGDFNLSSRGELTVTNAVTNPDEQASIPFYVYLKRNGTKVLVAGDEATDPAHTKIDISEILQHAQPGDYLVIEAVNKEESAVNSILKVLPLGC